MRVYLDANPIIYSIEGVPEFRAAALAWIEQAEAAGGAVITSRLSALECRVKPLRDGNTELLARFEGFLAREGLALAGITAEVVDRNSPRGECLPQVAHRGILRGCADRGVGTSLTV